jgi:ATP-binding cassette, subfamily B, bacterial PglK
MFVMKTNLIQAIHLLSPDHQKKGAVIIPMLVIQSLFDFLSVASFLPLIFFIVNPQVIHSNSNVKAVYQYFNFSSNTGFIIGVALCILLFTLFKTACSILINRVKADYIFSIGKELSSRAIDKYLQLGYPGFTEADYSRETNRILAQPITFANSIILPIGNLLSEGLICIFIVTCIFLYDYRIVLFLLTIMSPLFLIYGKLKTDAKKIGAVIKEKYPLALKYARQIVESIIEIRLYKKDSYFSGQFNKTNDDLAKALAADNVAQQGIVRLTEVITAAVVCVLVIFTVLSGQSYQQTILILGIYASASFRIIPSINRLLLASFQIRTHDYLIKELEHLIVCKNQQVHPDANDRVFMQKLELKNVSFGYNEKRNILQDINLSIEKGMKVAITGKSGEGKTTLLLILLNFIRNYKGEILIDGTSARHDTSLQKIIGYVPQNPLILDATISENIAFGVAGDKIDKQKVLQLMDALDLTDLLRHSPNGIDTVVGERGAKLSGGQRQRIAIARALYTNAEILLLDEITNQVHEALEQDIMKLLDSLAVQQKTIIMVTHKRPEPDFFDAIYVLEKGKLSERIKV